MLAIKDRKVARNPVAHLGKNVIKRHLIIMSDATGGSKYSIFGAVVYLRLTFEITRMGGF